MQPHCDIFSQYSAYKVDRTNKKSLSQKPNFDQKHLDEGNIRIIQADRVIEIGVSKSTKEEYYFAFLPINFTIKRKNQRLFREWNIQNYITLLSDLDRIIKCTPCENDQFDYRDNPKLVALLSLLVDHDSNSDVMDKLQNFQKRVLCRSKKRSIDALMGREANRVEEVWVWILRLAKINSNFRPFPSIRIHFIETNQCFRMKHPSTLKEF